MHFSTTLTLRLHGDLPNSRGVASRLPGQGLRAPPVVRVAVVRPQHDRVVVAAGHQQGHGPRRVPLDVLHVLSVFLWTHKEMDYSLSGFTSKRSEIIQSRAFSVNACWEVDQK
eukprot:scaffold538774_cov24-Prasinocladus_malaysianus.AAC.2